MIKFPKIRTTGHYDPNMLYALTLKLDGACVGFEFKRGKLIKVTSRNHAITGDFFNSTGLLYEIGAHMEYKIKRPPFNPYGHYVVYGELIGGPRPPMRRIAYSITPQVGIFAIWADGTWLARCYLSLLLVDNIFVVPEIGTGFIHDLYDEAMNLIDNDYACYVRDLINDKLIPAYDTNPTNICEGFVLTPVFNTSENMMIKVKHPMFNDIIVRKGKAQSNQYFNDTSKIHQMIVDSSLAMVCASRLSTARVKYNLPDDYAMLRDIEEDLISEFPIWTSIDKANKKKFRNRLLVEIRKLIK